MGLKVPWETSIIALSVDQRLLLARCMGMGNHLTQVTLCNLLRLSHTHMEVCRKEEWDTAAVLVLRSNSTHTSTTSCPREARLPWQIRRLQHRRTLCTIGKCMAMDRGWARSKLVTMVTAHLRPSLVRCTTILLLLLSISTTRNIILRPPPASPISTNSTLS